MKIKSFQLFNESAGAELEGLIKSAYNQNLINDVCDMALDDIDDGMTLKIVITDFKNNVLCTHHFNHTKKNITFEKYYNYSIINKEGKITTKEGEIIENVKSNKLKYYILLHKTIHKGSPRKWINIPLTTDLVNRTKDIYPDENIQVFSFDKISSIGSSVNDIYT